MTPASGERHIVCIFQAKPEHRDAVRALLEQCVATSRTEPGCLYYDLYQIVQEPDRMVLLDGWASDAAIAAHVAEPHVKKVMEDLAPLLAGPQEILISDKLT